jgi:AcrR family transcriptional regulator
VKQEDWMELTEPFGQTHKTPDDRGCQARSGRGDWERMQRREGEMSQPEILSPEKQAQILRGAATVFAEDGYEGASMSRIAATAGVSKGTLYNYFAGKAELFAAFVADSCDRFLARVFEPVRPDADPAEVLHGIGLRMVDIMLAPQSSMIYRVVVSEAEKFPELARCFYDSGPARVHATLADYLARATALGRLRVADPGFAAEQFLALCQTRYGLKCKLLLIREPAPADIDQVIAASVAMFLATYGT